MNVIPAWLDGVTGKGAVVTILDDGLEKDHPDLIKNYVSCQTYLRLVICGGSMESIARLGSKRFRNNNTSPFL